VEVDVGEHPEVPLHPHGIFAHEQVFVPGEPHHQVAGAEPDPSAVVEDPDDGGVEVSARTGIPAGHEGRIERKPVVGDLDPLDQRHIRAPQLNLVQIG
jgi:hypothetical protein